MSSMIKSHNKKVINKDIKELKSYNCSLKSKCPLTCQCQVTDIYINALYYHQTNQIKCISELLRVISESDFIIIGSRLTAKVVQTIPYFQNIFPNLNLTLVGSIAKKVPTYSNISKKCLLCLHEKLETINYPRPEELLNRRSELISRCRHANKFLLFNYKTKH